MSTIIRKFPYNINMQIFQTRLIELRKQKNLSQKELAIILQTNNSSICDWERGRTQPDIETIVKIAIYFETSTDYLLGLVDEADSKSYGNYNNYGTHNGNNIINNN